MIRRGDIYWVEIPNQKPRPAVVISPGFLNEVRPRVLAAPCTSQRVEEIARTEVLLDTINLPKPTKVQCQDIASINKTNLKTRLRPLTPGELTALDQALEIAIGLW